MGSRGLLNSQTREKKIFHFFPHSIFPYSPLPNKLLVSALYDLTSVEFVYCTNLLNCTVYSTIKG